MTITVPSSVKKCDLVVARGGHALPPVPMTLNLMEFVQLNPNFARKKNWNEKEKNDINLTYKKKCDFIDWAFQFNSLNRNI